MIQEIKEGSWLQFNAILPETQTFGFLMEMKSNFLTLIKTFRL